MTEAYTIPLKQGINLNYIGFRDPDFNRRQYSEHAAEYIADNPYGLRGGKTPAKRVAAFSQLLAPGKTVLEVGSGPGHDARELDKAGYRCIASDVVPPFIKNLTAMGLETMYFDARTDSIPDGVDGIYAHISLLHISPRELAIFLARARNTLNQEGAIFLSVVKGYGHERTKRTGKFKRDFYLYTPGHLGRLARILDQEGIDRVFLEEITADNGTVTLHAGGTFSKEYQKRSLGARGLHPFGDVFYTSNALYKGNLIHDLVDAQVKDGLLQAGKGDFTKAGKRAYYHGLVTADEMGKAINEHWAKELTGWEVNTVMQHAENFLNQQPRFRPLTEAALAVCKNNGFSNTLVGYEPSWLLEVLSKRLGMDREFSVQWRTEHGTQFEGKIAGDVYYVQNNTDPEIAVLRHQKRLRELLDSGYKRTTIGVGQSLADTGFLSKTDYPIFAFPNREGRDYASLMGFFTDRKGKAIYADSQPWLRWGVLDEGTKLVMYLHMVTSDRFPIRPTRSDYFFSRLLWQCPGNRLNPSFYRDNQAYAGIL